MSLLTDIETFLIAENIAGGLTDWGLFKSFLPETPSQNVAIFETGGPPILNTSDGDLRHPTFQVRVRGDVYGYEDTRAKMQEIIDTLHDATISGYVYVYATQSGPIPLGNDNNNRPSLAINFRVLED